MALVEDLAAEAGPEKMIDPHSKSRQVPGALTEKAAPPAYMPLEKWAVGLKAGEVLPCLLTSTQAFMNPRKY